MNNIKNLQQLMNQANQAKKKLDKFKSEIFVCDDKEDGAIKIKINGDYQIDLTIDFTALISKYDQDYETINDVIQIAVNEAISIVKKKENNLLQQGF